VLLKLFRQGNAFRVFGDRPDIRNQQWVGRGPMPPIVMKKTGEPTPKDERAASARVQRRGFAHGSEVTGSLIVQFIGCSCGDDILKNLLQKVRGVE